MSDLRHAITDYLAIRRAPGFQLRGYDRLLGDLVDDLQRAEASTLTIELAAAWASKPSARNRSMEDAAVSIARGFARYLHTIDPATQIPPSNLLAYRRARPARCLYSAAELDALPSSPARQSMSSSVSAATLPARSPSRTSTVRIA
jgi:integrase/recombinase XerD